MKRKTLWIIGIVVILLISAGAGAFWWMAQQPLYNPGMVRAGQNLRASLTPPAQPDDPDFWQVEPDIRLYHFSEGCRAQCAGCPRRTWFALPGINGRCG